MPEKIVHPTVDIRGVLRWPNSKLHGLVTNDFGDPLPVDQVRAWLNDHLAQGHEVLPLGPECPGFDYRTGCPGHEKGAE